MMPAAYPWKDAASRLGAFFTTDDGAAVLRQIKRLVAACTPESPRQPTVERRPPGRIGIWEPQTKDGTIGNIKAVSRLA